MTTVEITRHAPPVWLLIALSAIGPVTIHLILPALPALQTLFAVDFATTQLLVSLFAISFGGGQLVVGPLADLFGRQRVLVAGLVLFCATSFLAPLAPTMPVLIALRTLQGLGACAGVVLARAIIRDHHTGAASTRYFGYLAMGMSLGPIAAPTIGGLIIEMGGWQMPFWLLSVVGALILVLTLAMVPRDLARVSERGSLRRLLSDIGLILKDRKFRLSFFSVALNSGAVFTFLACAPLVSQSYMGLSPAQYGMWAGTGAIGYMLGNFLAGRLAGRFTGGAVLSAGVIGVAALAGAIFALLAAGLMLPGTMFLLFAGVMLFTGLVIPNAYQGAMASVPSAAGSASGFVGAAQYVSGAIFATFAGHMLEQTDTASWMGLVMLAASGVGVVIILPLLRRDAAIRL